MALGTFGLLNSAVAFVAYYFATRLIKKHHRKKAILIGGLILYGAIFFLVFELTYVKLLFYAVTIAIAYPLLLVPYVSLTYDVIGRSWKAGEMRIEYIVVREIFLNGGRAVSVILFLTAVLFFDEQKSIPVLMCIIGAGHAMIYPFVRKIELEQAIPVPKEEPHPIVTTLRDGEGESKP
jgi:YQGE family putative transporter